MLASNAHILLRRNVMTDPRDEQSLNLEVDCIDELGRNVSPSPAVADEVDQRIDATAPLAGHSCCRLSQRGELQTADFGDAG